VRPATAALLHAPCRMGRLASQGTAGLCGLFLVERGKR